MAHPVAKPPQKARRHRQGERDGPETDIMKVPSAELDDKPDAIGVQPDRAPETDMDEPPRTSDAHERPTGNSHVFDAFGGASPFENSREITPALWVRFPISSLPDPFAEYVTDAAHARQCDPASVALPLLAVLAGAVGTARTLRVGSDWYAPSVLWTAVAAPSGAVKTPAFRAAMEPAEEIDRRDREAWRHEHAAFENELELFEVELSDWRRKKKGERGDPPKRPAEAPLPRIVVEDATLQALGRVLVENPRGVLLARDELSGWVRSFDQFTGAAGADLARWLEVHRAGPLRVDRVGSGHLYVPRAAVSICGTIQTDILPRVFGAEHQATGLLARFLLAAPPERVRQWQAVRCAKAPNVTVLVERIAALRRLDVPEEGDAPRALTLTAEAADRYGEWFDEHEARRQDTEPGAWRSAIAKLEETPGRLALILALGRSDDPAIVEAVDDDTMRRALELTDWFRVEGERIYAILSETAESRADRELVEWVAVHPNGATARDVSRNLRRYRDGGGGAKMAAADLDRLVADRLLTATERKGSRGPSATVYCRSSAGDTFPDDDWRVGVSLPSTNAGDGDRFSSAPPGDPETCSRRHSRPVEMSVVDGLGKPVADGDEQGEDCHACGQRKWWFDPSGRSKCAVCHPPPYDGPA